MVNTIVNFFRNRAYVGGFSSNKGKIKKMLMEFKAHWNCLTFDQRSSAVQNYHMITLFTNFFPAIFESCSHFSFEAKSLSYFPFSILLYAIKI